MSSLPPAPPPRPNHRRSASEEIPNSQQQQQTYSRGATPYGYPVYYPPAPHQQQYVAGYPPIPPQDSSRRQRAWSGDATSSQIPRQSSDRNLQHERQALLEHTASERYQQSKYSANSRRYHRKSHSYGAGAPAAPGYDAFFGQQPPSPTGRFSPRNEIMNFATSPTTLAHKGYGSLAWSPDTTAYYHQENPNTGETLFYARNKGESTRKKHMRQQSTQLFMADIKGEEQTPACRDVFFLVLFVFQLLGMVYLSHRYSYEALRTHTPTEVQDENSVTIYYKNLVYIAGFSGLFAVILSTTLLAAMTAFSRRFVQMTLLVVISMSFIWGTAGIGLSPNSIVPVTGIIALALAVGYAFIVWDRIPFAAANLLTALQAVRTFPVTIILALLVQALALGWSIYFVVILVGVYDSIKEGRIALNHRQATLVYVLLGVSYFWTYQVLLNTVQVATAAVIGQWWYQPEGQATLQKSTAKVLFYSMGSICLGSLVVAPVGLIRQLAVLVRPSSDDASLLCLQACLRFFQTMISKCVDGLTDHFNSMAFTMIGLYGYGFMEAGHRATEVFQKRGWTSIVSDDLVPTILLMSSLVIGGVTGVFGHLLSDVDRLRVFSIDQPGMVSFVTGGIIGLVVTSVLFGVISSAVDATLVCFCSSPVDFAQNHPGLSDEMRAAWREVWPGALDVVDLHAAALGENIRMQPPQRPPSPPPHQQHHHHHHVPNVPIY